MASYAQEFNLATTVLENILTPVRSDEFLQDYFGKSFLHVPGPKRKFRDLVSWNELNRILEEHRLEPPRLRLFQSGKELAADKYLSKPDHYGTRLNAVELSNLLALGATLAVDAFDELCRPVRDLALALERIFRIYVGVNLYAGWRTDQGFLLHYDDHDTVILQITGRKHWIVYRPTRLYPFGHGKDAESAEKPVEEPIWDNILEDGGMFYIPRGWWHVAYPVDEPTLHLTVGLRNYRGLDFLSWLVKQLKNCLEVRQDIPHLADRNTQLAYMEELRKHVFSRWSDDVLDDFLASADNDAILRPHFQLPEAATQEGLVVSTKSQVRLSGPRPLDLSVRTEKGGLKFTCAGKILHCSEKVLPVLETLNDGQYHDVSQLMSVALGETGSVLNFLQGLVVEKMLTTAPETLGNPQCDKGGINEQNDICPGDLHGGGRSFAEHRKWSQLHAQHGGFQDLAAPHERSDKG